MRTDHAAAAAMMLAALALAPFRAPLGAQAVPPAAAQPDTALLAILRATNPELIALRSALAAREARARATGHAPPATLGAEVEEVPNGIDLPGAGSMRLELSRTILGGARREARRALATEDVHRIRVELELAERRVVASATRLLARAGSAEAIARRLAAEDSLLSSAEDALRPRFAVGEARYVDVLRLRTERLRARSDLAAARSEARMERQRLTALMAGSDEAGEAPGGPTLAPAVAGTPAWRADSLIAALIAREAADPASGALPQPPPLDSLVAWSGAVRRADAAIARAEASRRLLLAEQRPLVQATLGAQRFVSDGGPTLGATLGASVSLPFTAGRANQLAGAAATSAVSAARAARQAAVAEVRANLRVALESYRAATERLALYDAALLVGAREERESALAAYRNGELSLLELLDFERALTRAETDRLRSRMAAADALAQLTSGDVESTVADPDPDLSGLVPEAQ